MFFSHNTKLYQDESLLMVLVRKWNGMQNLYLVICIYTKELQVYQEPTCYYILLLKPFLETLTGNFSNEEYQVRIIFQYSHNNHYVPCSTQNSNSMVCTNSKKKRLQKLIYLRLKHTLCGLFTENFSKFKCMVHSTADSTTYYSNDVLKIKENLQ